MSTETRRLYRSQDERMIGGICGGLGEFLGMDPTIVRLLAVLITFMWPFTPLVYLVYLVLMLVIPEQPLSQENAQAEAEVEKKEP